MDERKSVEGTNAARDKPMVSDLSTQLEHAAWQDGARTPIGTARACRVARWCSYSYRHRSRMPRDKMAATCSFCRHRSRMPRDMAATYSFCWHRSCTSLGASSPCKVDGTRAKDPLCSSWFLTRSSMPIQAWPVHQTRPNLGVGLRRWIDGMKDDVVQLSRE